MGYLFVWKGADFFTHTVWAIFSEYSFARSIKCVAAGLAAWGLATKQREAHIKGKLHGYFYAQGRFFLGVLCKVFVTSTPIARLHVKIPNMYSKIISSNANIIHEICIY